jgi:hypothetical protein
MHALRGGNSSAGRSCGADSEWLPLKHNESLRLKASESILRFTSERRKLISVKPTVKQIADFVAAFRDSTRGCGQASRAKLWHSTWFVPKACGVD